MTGPQAAGGRMSRSRLGRFLYAGGVALAFSLGLLLGRTQSIDTPIARAPDRPIDAKDAPVRPAPTSDASAPNAELERLRADNSRLAARLHELDVAATETKTAAPMPPANADPKTLEEAVAAMRAALAAGKEDEFKRLAGILQRLIGTNPDLALELLGLAQGESDARLAAALYGAVPNNEVLADARVRAKVLAILRGSSERWHKVGALKLLNMAIRRDGAVLDLVTEEDITISLNVMRWERDAELRQQAAQLLQRFATRPEVAAALRDLAGKIGDESVDARLAALESVRTIEGPETVALLLHVLKDDPDEKMRRKAIESLAILAPKESKEEVVAALEGAIAKEKNNDQRGLMLLGLIRVAPESASPVIKRILPTVEDPKHREMLTATAEMLDAGERDWLKIMIKLQGRAKGK